MKRLSPTFLFAAAAAAISVLPGCVSQTARLGLPCPVPGVLVDAESASVFRAGGQGAGDLVYKTTLSSAAVGCDYDTKRRVHTSVSFNMNVERGPAGAAGKINVPYFVAVTRGSAILARESFTRTVELTADPVTKARESIDHITIPLAKGLTGGSYNIVVGLAVSQDQVRYNRTKAIEIPKR